MSETNVEESPEILLGGNGTRQVKMSAAMANRHGMIAGATGTGKTVSLQVLAEFFSRLGVPVFLADVKGDLSGLGKAATPHPKIDERIEYIQITDYQSAPCPVVFWDMLGKRGHPIRTTVSEMGPLLLSSLLELNDTQTGVMYSCFRIADDNGWLILDFKDLRSMLGWMGDNARELKSNYGNIATSSVGAIQRGLLILEEQGAANFMGEPAVSLQDLMGRDLSGRGIVHILDVTQVIQSAPRLYATFLLWLMSELFENLPEVGDADRPKFVLFFDEAHLIFDDAPEALLKKIERVVRLIRSKGVGIFFISQSPLDVPESILGQLGLKIQHALRAFTPRDQKAVKAVAQTFRANPAIDAEQTIIELGTGEALVSCLDEDGSPTPVERTLMMPPESRIGPMSDEERSEQISRSPFKGRYDELLDRESAYEVLKKRAEQEAEIAEKTSAEKTSKDTRSGKSSTRQTPFEALIKSAASSFGTQMGRQIMRGVLGSIFKGK